jgi:radical SAM/Cys-rich protein
MNSVTSLLSRRSALAEPSAQLRVLADVTIPGAAVAEANFERELAAFSGQGLWSSRLEILQINVGKLCNMACRHCHVDAGPDQTEAVMTKETAQACLEVLDSTTARTVDITGGAPELNPSFTYLIEEAVARGKRVIDRCNLTVLLLPQFLDLPKWLADHGVEVVASLPHYRRRNSDALRGPGVFEKSIEALRRLNDVGYGKGDPARQLTLMTNPAGAFLAGDQSALEPEWKAMLEHEHDVTFDKLIALNNMPIARYLEWLVDSGNFESYMRRLVEAFNPNTITGLMCRNTMSISWDGRVFDCDFNQMLDLEAILPSGQKATVWGFDADEFYRRRIRTGRHCYGCTAGAGSSCGGAIAD